MTLNKVKNKTLKLLVGDCTGISLAVTVLCGLFLLLILLLLLGTALGSLLPKSFSFPLFFVETLHFFESDFGAIIMVGSVFLSFFLFVCEQGRGALYLILGAVCLFLLRDQISVFYNDVSIFAH